MTTAPSLFVQKGDWVSFNDCAGRKDPALTHLKERFFQVISIDFVPAKHAGNIRVWTLQDSNGKEFKYEPLADLLYSSDLSSTFSLPELRDYIDYEVVKAAPDKARELNNKVNSTVRSLLISHSLSPAVADIVLAYDDTAASQ